MPEEALIRYAENALTGSDFLACDEWELLRNQFVSQLRLAIKESSEEKDEVIRRLSSGTQFGGLSSEEIVRILSASNARLS